MTFFQTWQSQDRCTQITWRPDSQKAKVQTWF